MDKSLRNNWGKLLIAGIATALLGFIFIFISMIIPLYYFINLSKDHSYNFYHQLSVILKTTGLFSLVTSILFSIAVMKKTDYKVFLLTLIVVNSSVILGAIFFLGIKA